MTHLQSGFHQATEAELQAELTNKEGPQPDGAAILQEVHGWLGRFVSYPDNHALVAHVLWTAHCQLMNQWESTPRLAFLSPEPGSGKSRALEVTAPLVPRPLHAVNVSPAYLFRKVADEDGLPTILFDEIDTVFGPKTRENEELRGLLNAGHRKGAIAGRCAYRGKEIITEDWPAYAAVALAGLGNLPDTIMSRTIVIRMRRRAPGERVESYRIRLHEQEGRAIGDRLADWCDSIPKPVSWPDLPDTVQDRDADVWEPLIAIADRAGGDWPTRARDAAVAMVAQNKERPPSLGVTLLRDLQTVFDQPGFDGCEALRTTEIISALCALDEAPWGELHGKPIDARRLARLLSPYGVASVTFRDGSVTAKGYRRADMHDARKRYL